jgi:hypothetical protein
MKPVFLLHILILLQVFSLDQALAQGEGFTTKMDGSSLSSTSQSGREDVPSIGVSMIHPLRLGSFHAGPGGGTIRIGVNGERSSEGDITLLHMGETARPASYEIQCPPLLYLQLLVDPSFKLQSENGEQLEGMLLLPNNEQIILSPRASERGFVITIGCEIQIPPGLSAGTFFGNASFTVLPG